MKKDIAKILLTREEIGEKVKDLANQIKGAYEGKNPLILCILKGSLIFTADLVRELDFPCTIDFMQVSSYGAGAETTGELRIKKDMDTDIRGRSVIIVEDILDSGITLSNLIPELESRGAESVAVCVLLNKPERRRVEVKPNFVGFDIENEFAVGYGLDYNEKYRNLPYVGVLKREIYEK
ncbi:MAG: hypoxanthine phosphoribosyltransferase [Oscillospiraceae bacterium]|nr:hypoxanthine phosphoribosyltransferase [Oscillospiraceae bacterium]MBQ4545184.1 hypoxanthine phosphoribosyltransferase [Oscillospiraceae bacterium]MBQ6902571.1 hypoxanthine phosphoribosyltransferase [Oscillospiraceae bacterium]